MKCCQGGSGGMPLKKNLGPLRCNPIGKITPRTVCSCSL